MNSTIEIHRSSLWAYRFHSYSLFLDGQKIGKIKNGETVQYEVTPGEHTIQTRVDFRRSNLMKFDVVLKHKVLLNIDCKYLSKWRKILYTLAFCLIMTIGSFFGLLGIGLGSGIGSIFLIEIMGKPHIHYKGSSSIEEV